MSIRNKNYEDTRGVYELLSHLRSAIDSLREKKEAAEAEVRRLQAERLTVPEITGWSAGDVLPEFQPGERVIGLMNWDNEYRLVVCEQGESDVPSGQIRSGNGYLRYSLRCCAFWIREADFVRQCGVFPPVVGGDSSEAI